VRLAARAGLFARLLRHDMNQIIRLGGRMTVTALSLDHFRTNSHSQAGEDGILAEIFQRLGIEKGVFCEFGAWDGQHLSNTYALCRKGWSGWYIEGNEARYGDLLRNITAPDVERIRAWVRISGEDSLDGILTRSRLYREDAVRHIDLLSIDIDSDDLAIWKSLKAFRPKVVIIEINPTIPLDVHFENPPGQFLGNSPRSTFDFARSQDYGLVATTACNMIFVDQRLPHQPLPCLDLTDPSLVFGMRYFFGFDGSLIVKCAHSHEPHQIPDILRVPWNGARFAQPVARSFRSTSQSRTVRRVWHFLSRLRLTLMHPIAVLSGNLHRS
jgi:hypothetical protein